MFSDITLFDIATTFSRSQWVWDWIFCVELKGSLSHSPQNNLPIHWKICISFRGENLEGFRFRSSYNFENIPMSPQTVKGSHYTSSEMSTPDNKVHGANMGPIWGWQNPGGPHVGPMNFAICNCFWSAFLGDRSADDMHNAQSRINAIFMPALTYPITLCDASLW